MKQKGRNPDASRRGSSIRKRIGTKKFIRLAFKQEYPPFYLALSLAVFSVVVAVMFGSVTAAHWEQGLTLLNVSDQLAEVSASFVEAVSPMVELAVDVAKFYELAAAEMSELLVVEHFYFNDAVAVVDGVQDFYYLASLEMEELLDMSFLIPIRAVPQVAGACVQSNF